MARSKGSLVDRAPTKRELWEAFDLTHKVLSRAAEMRFKEHSLMRATILRAAAEAGSEGALQSNVVRLARRQSHTVSGLLTRMDKDGLIVHGKSPHLPSNRRVVKITKLGKEWLAVYDKLATEDPRYTAFEALSVEACRNLVAYMGSLLAHGKDSMRAEVKLPYV